MNHRLFLFPALLLAGLAVAGCVETTAPMADPSRIGSTAYVQASALNLRTCPSTRCEIIAVLKQAKTVTVLNARGGWLEVRVQDSGRTGWLSASYVGERRPAVSRARPAPKTTAPQLPEEEFAPVSTTAPPVTEEFGQIDAAGQPVVEPPPAVEEEFAK